MNEKRQKLDIDEKDDFAMDEELVELIWKANQRNTARIYQAKVPLIRRLRGPDGEEELVAISNHNPDEVRRLTFEQAIDLLSLNAYERSGILDEEDPI